LFPYFTTNYDSESLNLPVSFARVVSSAELTGPNVHTFIITHISSMATFLGLLTQKMKELHFLEMLVTIYQSKQYNIPEESSPYQYCCENLKSCKEMEVKT
jgi:hypothetical protein